MAQTRQEQLKQAKIRARAMYIDFTLKGRLMDSIARDNKISKQRVHQMIKMYYQRYIITSVPQLVEVNYKGQLKNYEDRTKKQPKKNCRRKQIEMR